MPQESLKPQLSEREARDRLATLLETMLTELPPEERRSQMLQIGSLLADGGWDAKTVNTDNPERFVRSIMLDNWSFPWGAMKGGPLTWEQIVSNAEAAETPFEIVANLLPGRDDFQ